MTLKADLHLHTYYSEDSFLKPKEIIELCLKKGINCLAICDHEEIKGAFEVQEIAPFKVIIGEEITTSQGEVMGFFLKEKIPPFLTPEETIRVIKNQGGLVAVSHPFDYLRKDTIKKQTLERIIHLVDMIEIFNARNVFEKSNKKAREFCKKHGKISFAGSDAHTRYEIGSVRLIMEDFKTPEEFLESLKKAEFQFRKSPLWVHIITKFHKLKK